MAPDIGATPCAPATRHIIKLCRALANRLVGILHGCLTDRQAYSEHVAWSAFMDVAA
jgi:hypothetical protein